MRPNSLHTVTSLAEHLANAEGLRDGASAVAEHLVGALTARFAFVVGLHDDGEMPDVLAAKGLGVADFRRLEERLAKSGLWKMIRIGKPMIIDDLGRDAVLSFLSFGTASRMLLAVPVILKDSCLGLIAAGFPAGNEPTGNNAIRLLTAAAAMTAQAIRVERAASLEGLKLIEENSQLRQELREKYDFRRLVGKSSPMREVYDRVTQIARTNSAVLLRGESGTGKELIAATIHYNSLRSKRPFVKIACGSISPELIDTALFGQVSGKAGDLIKKGRVEAADGGTLFLDEIGTLPAGTQARLLKLIEERVLERPGGDSPVEINIRLVAATAADLEHSVEESRFSRDLFTRLSSFSVFLPPLRDRKSDILLLADHFLEKYSGEHNKEIRRISTPAIDMLTAYHYPGNVRELENAIENAVIACDANVVHGHHLPPTLQTAELSGTESRITLTSAVEAFERDMIQDALKSTRGNIASAARMLDSTERILGYKIGKYGIDPARFKR